MTRRQTGIPGYKTIEDAQEALGVSRRQLYRLLEKHGVRTIKVANAAVFTDADIERVKEERASYTSE